MEETTPKVSAPELEGVQDLDGSSNTGCSESELTDGQHERIALNRQKALALRRARVRTRPYDKPTPSLPESLPPGQPSSQPGVERLEDTRGGFLLDSSELEEAAIWQERHCGAALQDDAPLLGDELIQCEECSKRFAESYLWSKFDLPVCNSCRDPDGKHALITKTEAKEKWLLKECDFGEREGKPLPYIVRRNPHSSWGEMKLFLVCQVKTRSLAVWGDGEKLDEEKQRRSNLREKKKEKKYAKEVRELRKAVYASTNSVLSRSHQHSYLAENEKYDPSTDTWSKTCSDCGHTITFEKM